MVLLSLDHMVCPYSSIMVSVPIIFFFSSVCAQDPNSVSLIFFWIFPFCKKGKSFYMVYNHYRLETCCEMAKKYRTFQPSWDKNIAEKCNQGHFHSLKSSIYSSELDCKWSDFKVMPYPYPFNNGYRIYSLIFFCSRRDTCIRGEPS